MDNALRLNRNVAIVGEGMLLVWWGIVILLDPLTLSMGAIGTGLILLGLNAARLLKGVPTKRSTTIVGFVALVWGSLDLAFALSFGASFAALLIVVGVATLASPLIRPQAG
jgi:hypothetical protein